MTEHCAMRHTRAHVHCLSFGKVSYFTHKLQEKPRKNTVACHDIKKALHTVFAHNSPKQQSEMPVTGLHRQQKVICRACFSDTAEDVLRVMKNTPRTSFHRSFFMPYTDICQTVHPSHRSRRKHLCNRLTDSILPKAYLLACKSLPFRR